MYLPLALPTTRGYRTLAWLAKPLWLLAMPADVLTIDIGGVREDYWFLFYDPSPALRHSLARCLFLGVALADLELMCLNLPPKIWD